MSWYHIVVDQCFMYRLYNFTRTITDPVILPETVSCVQQHRASEALVLLLANENGKRRIRSKRHTLGVSSFSCHKQTGGLSQMHTQDQSRDPRETLTMATLTVTNQIQRPTLWLVLHELASSLSHWGVLHC